MRQAKFSKTLTIAISQKQFDAVKRITDQQCISMSEWFRTAAEKILAKNNNKEGGIDHER